MINIYIYKTRKLILYVVMFSWKLDKVKRLCEVACYSPKGSVVYYIDVCEMQRESSSLVSNIISLVSIFIFVPF